MAEYYDPADAYERYLNDHAYEEDTAAEEIRQWREAFPSSKVLTPYEIAKECQRKEEDLEGELARLRGLLLEMSVVVEDTIVKASDFWNHAYAQSIYKKGLEEIRRLADAESQEAGIVEA